MRETIGRGKPKPVSEIIKEADLMAQRYQTQIRRQANRITLFGAFLQEKGLTEEFIEWERFRSEHSAD